MASNRQNKPRVLACLGQWVKLTQVPGSRPYLSLNMPFFPKNFRIPRPISFFLAKKKFSRFARKRSSEAQFRKQIRGERRFPTPPPSAGTPPFSLESVTLVAEKQGNSAFKHIPHLFSVKLVAKPRYATFLKNALTIAPFFYSQTMSWKGCNASLRRRRMVRYFFLCPYPSFSLLIASQRFWRSHGTQHFFKMLT